MPITLNLIQNHF